MMTLFPSPRWRMIVWAALICLPAAVNLILVIVMRNDAIVQDTFSLLEPVFNHAAGNLRISSFTNYHAGGHLIVVPRILAFVLFQAGLWSPLLHFVWGWFFTAVSAWLLWILLQRTHAHLPLERRLGLQCALTWLLFLWVQFLHQHLTWGVLLALLLTLWALLLLTKGPSLSNVITAVTLCALASFSFGSGLASWFAILPLLIERRHLRWNLLLWSSALLVTLSLFFWQYWVFFQLDPLPHSPLAVAVDPFFFIRLLGAPWVPFLSRGRGIVGGVVVVVSAILFLRSRHDPHARPWIGLLLFGIAAAALITVSRGHLGANRATSIWYPSMTGMTSIACFPLLWLRLPRVQILQVITILLVAVACLSIPRAMEVWAQQSNDERRGYECLRTAAGTAPFSCLFPVHEQEPYIRSMAEPLRALKLL